MYPIITLKEKKEANVAFRHPWLFSGALEDASEEVEHGALVRVADRKGRILGTGTLSLKSSIAVRVLDFSDTIIDKAWFIARFKAAQAKRDILGYGPGTDTTGYRVVFGESDGMPGLVVDRYEDVLVAQISTMGMELLNGLIVSALQEVFTPRAIVARNDINVRKEEGLEETVEMLFGDAPEPVEFKERGMRFVADVMKGQKTGFFLDQKDTRAQIEKLVAGKNVLNLFSYTGASGIAAMRGAARLVHNVDSSEPALAQCQAHAELNGISTDKFTIENADIFQWLGAESEEQTHDVVIMDPPALIKSRKDAEQGQKAYHFLNRAAMRRVKDGGLFITSSCSHYLPEEDLAFILRRASVQSGIDLSVLAVVRQSGDHPLSVYYPEAAYLKTFICQVRRTKVS